MSKNKGGNPGKFAEWITEEGLLKLEGWARDGLTDEQIAHNIGIATSTIYVWKNKYEEFADALKKGKEVVDREVENALLKRALGYQFDEVTKERVTVRNEETGEIESVLIETKRVTKEVQPDTTAQIFWLKNRKPAEWRDKQDIEHSGGQSLNVVFDSGMIDDE